MSQPYDHINRIKAWAEEDRPREKLMLKGKSSLSDAELLAIIMGSGNKDETAVDLARRILNDCKNNWHELSRLSINDLMKYKGIGEAKAISILTALEIGSRKSHQLALEKPKVNSSVKAYDLLKHRMADLNVEQFWIIYTNQALKVINMEQISTGGLTQTIVDKRIIFKKALERNATGFIIAHNHPSGNLEPSQSDIRLTRELKQAADYLDIALNDHIIVAATNYYSFNDEGML